MSRWRRLCPLIAVAAALLTAAGPAHAEPYPAQSPPASVSHGTVSNGGTITFSGTGFLPFEKVSITVGYAGSNATATLHQASGRFVLARRMTLTTTADAHGSFSITVKLTEVGTATLVATGLTSGHSVTATVEVVAPSAGDQAPPARDQPVALPTTGQSAAPLLLAVSGGTGLVLLGTAVVWRTRRRSPKPARP